MLAMLTMWPDGLRPQQRQERFDAVDRAPQVDAEHSRKVLIGGMVDRRHTGDTGVVDHDISDTVHPCDLSSELLNRSLITNVDQTCGRLGQSS
jgi:hypothetical protein